MPVSLTKMCVQVAICMAQRQLVKPVSLLTSNTLWLLLHTVMFTLSLLILKCPTASQVAMKIHTGVKSMLYASNTSSPISLNSVSSRNSSLNQILPPLSLLPLVSTSPQNGAMILSPTSGNACGVCESIPLRKEMTPLVLTCHQRKRCCERDCI